MHYESQTAKFMKEIKEDFLCKSCYELYKGKGAKGSN